MSQTKHVLAKQIIRLLEDDLGAAGFELLDVRIFSGGGRLQVRIFVDKPGGINLDGCAKASRTADMLLEESGLIDERYVIEVSSPGIRRPLRRQQHFAACIGQNVEVKLGPGTAGRKLRGELVAADKSAIHLKPVELGSSEESPDQPQEPAIIALAYGNILEANLDPEFDVQALIRADRREKKAAKRQARQARQAKKAKKRHKE